eukprot:5946781-Pyramimonas_sp.AAC.1
MARLHIAGGWVDQSHAMQYQSHLKLCYCKLCGSFASEVLRELGKACTKRITTHRAVSFDRSSRGLWPKVLSAREKQSRGRV